MSFSADSRSDRSRLPHLRWPWLGMREPPGQGWDRDKGCECGAGMPCECQRANGLEQPDVSKLMDERAYIPLADLGTAKVRRTSS